MSRPSKYSGIVVNLLIAVAISLVVNFSYVLLLVVEKSDDRHPPFSRELRTDREIVRVEGDVWISPDGHGYLLYVSPERLSDGDAAATGLAEVAPARDSVYIPRNSARFLRLRSGDHLLADALESHRSGGRLVLGQVLERNGEPFDYGVIFERPQEGVIFAPAAGRPRAADVGIFQTRSAVCGACRRALFHRPCRALADARADDIGAQRQLARL